MITRFVVNSVQGLLASARAALSGLACRTETVVNEHAGVPARAPAVRARNPSARHMEEESNGSNDHGGLGCRRGGRRVVFGPLLPGGPPSCPRPRGGARPHKAPPRSAPAP